MRKKWKHTWTVEIVEHIASYIEVLYLRTLIIEKVLIKFYLIKVNI